MFECRIKCKKYPEEGAAVVARTASISNGVLMMKLIEYGEIEGIVLSGEISKRRIRSIHQITKVGSTEVVRVLSVDPIRGHIDLSLRDVEEDEKAGCLENARRNKLAYQIALKVAKAVGVSVSRVYEQVGYVKEEQFGSFYTFLASAKENPKILEGVEYGDVFGTVILEQFKASAFKVRADVDVTNSKYGVEAIKEAFNKALAECPGISVVLLRAPTFSITTTAESKEEAFELVNRACEVVKEASLANGGTFALTNAAKVYGEKQKHLLLENVQESGSEEFEESE